MLVDEKLTGAITGAAIEVHRVLKPGLLESAYELCLCHELGLRDIRFRRQVQLPVEYKGFTLECGYRIDLLVEERVIVEIKSVKAITPIDEAQLLTYLRLHPARVGFLINFNVPILRDGITRRVL